MLQEALQAEINRRGLSVREAAREMNISHTTAFRVLKGGPFDIPTLVAISTWLKVRPSTLLDNLQTSDTINQVALLIEAAPGILGVLDEAVKEVEKGRASPEIVQDIIAYALYKLSLRGDTSGTRPKASKSDGGRKKPSKKG
jgi:transcriptional regulator with XRE-family HTH domain